MAEIQSNLVDLTVVYSKLNAQLDENITRLNAGAVAVENYNKKISNVPSQFQKALVDIKQKTDAVATSTNSLMQAEKKANQERVKELQLQKQREVAIDKYNNQLAKEEAKLASATNMYNRLQSELNKLTVAYQNLAVRQAQGATLTKAEAQQMDYLQKRIQNHDKTLKAVDATMGKYQRNVGNYGSAFNPLQNSINQLGREMPAFANSVQTGFMAISNNLPIFFDALSQTTAEVNRLKKAGEQTPSVFSRLASSLFSFQTLLSVGVTLLTVYGKEIGNWVSELWGASEALDELNKNQKEFNSARFQGKKDAQSDIIELKKYLAVYNDTRLSVQDREIAYKKLSQQYAYYIKNVSDATISNGKYSAGVSKLLVDLAKQKALEKETDVQIKNKKELIELNSQLNRLEADLPDIRKRANRNVDLAGADPQMAGLKRQTSGELDSTLSKIETLKLQVSEYQEKINQNEVDIILLTKERIGLEYTQEDQRAKKAKQIRSEIDLDLELADVQASLFEQEKAFLERDIKMYDELANSDKNTLQDRITAFKNFTDKKLELQILEYNESVRLSEQSFNSEKEQLNQTYNEYIRKEGITANQRIKAKTELTNALTSLEEKHKIDLGVLEIKHSNNIVEITRATFEKIKQLQEIYNGAEFNKKIKDQELKDLLEHKNRLLNIDLKTTQKQLDSISKANKESSRKIQEDTLQNDISVINKKLSNSKLSSLEELKLKTELYEKLKALNQLEISDLEEKKRAQEDYLNLLKDTYNGFIEEFSSNTGFGKLLDIVGGGLDKFKDDAKATALVVSEAFQEAFNTISNASQANFDAEYTRLEMQKENSLRFAGDSATAREEIERQAEEKRKAIARREAEAQKRLAIFNTVIDTAQAVVSALPNIPLSVAIGVIGAAQIALIASQQIPQFWMGGEHDGGLMMVNDGKGSNYRETIVTPDGKIEKPTGRNVIMNRPKGTQIFTHEQWNEVINKQLSSAGIQPMRSTIETISQQNSLTTEDFNAGISKLAKSMQSNKGGNTQVYLNNKPINTDYFKGKKV